MWCCVSGAGWSDVLLPMLLVWLLNGIIAVGVFVSLFTFGEPVTKPSTSASVAYWRHRNQADSYLRRVCVPFCLFAYFWCNSGLWAVRAVS